MISQIQPHFMFNTLSTIQALCSIDPKMAADTIEKFGTFLRQNIDSLNYTDLIPISKEIEHTRVYYKGEYMSGYSWGYNTEAYLSNIIYKLRTNICKGI